MTRDECPVCRHHSEAYSDAFCPHHGIGKDDASDLMEENDAMEKEISQLKGDKLEYLIGIRKALIYLKNGKPDEAIPVLAKLLE